MTVTSYTFNISSGDMTGDRSDVLSMLQTIDHLYLVSRSVLNDHTQTSLRMAIAIEGQMLQAKLQAMGQRWKNHLPFKEACQVDFYDWAKRMETICNEILSTGDEEEQQKRNIYCPSKHFLLDLYAMLPESLNEGGDEKPYYHEIDVALFVKRQEEMRRKITGSWKEYVKKVSDQTISDLSANQKVEISLTYDPVVVKTVCSDVLKQLSEELLALNNRLTSPISKKDFTRLADRILKEKEYGGTKALARAKVQVNTWRNETPYDMMESHRQTMIDTTIEQIKNTKYGGTFLQNVRINDDFDRQKERFGKFLFSVRKSISKDELTELFELIFRIHQFRLLTDADQDEPDDDNKQPFNTGQDSIPQQQQDSHIRNYPDLPVEFEQSFRDNTKAIVTFYRLLHEVGPYIGRQKKSKVKSDSAEARFGKWKWPHLKTALIRLKLLTRDAGSRVFAEYMNSVFTDRSSDSIYRALYRPDSPNSSSIVADIVKYFQPVREMIDKTAKSGL